MRTEFRAKNSVLGALVLLPLVLLLVASLPSPARSEGADYYFHCGKIKNLGPKKGGVRFTAFEVSCRRARKIVKAYVRSVESRLDRGRCTASHACHLTVGRLKCDTGSSAGACEANLRECGCSTGTGINFEYHFFWYRGHFVANFGW